MLLLSLLVLGFFLGANASAFVVVFLHDTLGVGLTVFVVVLTSLSLAIAAFLWWAMYQRARNYLRSGATRKSKRRGLVFAVLFHCLLIGLPATTWGRTIADHYEQERERRYGGKRCPVCNEYAVERRTPFGEPVTITFGSDGRMVTDGQWFRCRECRCVFRTRDAELVKVGETGDSLFPLFMEDLGSGEWMEKMLKDLERRPRPRADVSEEQEWQPPRSLRDGVTW